MISRFKRKVRSYSSDPHLREMSRGAALAFMLKILGAGLMFALNVVVARLLGVEDTGVYFLALSIVTISSVVARLGLDNALLRFIAINATHKDWGAVKGVYLLGTRIALVASAMVTLAVFLSAPFITSNLFNKPELLEPLRWMSFSILPLALLNLQAESLKGLKKVKAAMLVQGLWLPLFSLILLVPLVNIIDSAGASVAYSCASSVTFLLGLKSWRLAMVDYDDLIKPFSLKVFWVSCGPLFTVSILNRAILPWGAFLFLGVWVSSEDVGVFGAAQRVAMLVSFVLVAVNSVLAPKFAELYENGDISTLTTVARRSILLTGVIASPIFIALLFLGNTVLAFFGDGFEHGEIVLIILVIGQLVNVACG